MCYCSLLTADYAAVAVLISLGAVMGKLSPSQTLIMASNEVVFFAVNQFLGMGLFRVHDLFYLNSVKCDHTIVFLLQVINPLQLPLQYYW